MPQSDLIAFSKRVFHIDWNWVITKHPCAYPFHLSFYISKPRLDSKTVFPGIRIRTMEIRQLSEIIRKGKP